MQFHPGKNVGIGRDYTIYSLIDGLVKFEKFGPDRKKVPLIIPFLVILCSLLSEFESHLWLFVSYSAVCIIYMPAFENRQNCTMVSCC